MFEPRKITLCLRLAASWGGAPALLALAAPAWGQSRSTEPQADGLQDIIVTATRREANLQDIPIAVTALTAATLDNAGIESTRQLAQVTPGLVFSRSQASVQFALRGVSSRAIAPGDESTIAVYVDGVYQPSHFAAGFDLADVERIEVLRGPQGTLFGRNATAGLINVVTKSPSFDWTGSISARYSPKFNDRSVNAVISGPLSPKLAFSLSGLFGQDDGYVRNIVLNKTIGDYKRYAVRAKLLWEATDNIGVTLGGSLVRNNDNSAMAGTVLFNPILNIPQTVAIQVPGTPISTKPYTSTQNFDGRSLVKGRSAYLKVAVDMDVVTLESTSAYLHDTQNPVSDSDISALTRFNIISNSIADVLTQEIRLYNKGGRLEWTAGVFGYHGINRSDPSTVFTYSAAGALTRTVLIGRNETNSLAGYGEGTYNIAGNLYILAGLRYTWEKRHFAANRANYNAAGAQLGSIAAVDATASFSRLTPRFSVRYQFDPQSQVYATYSRGFKSGVFNTTGPNKDPTKPETLNSYEIGFKSKPLDWLRINASLFKYEYKDLQVGAIDPLTSLSSTLNAGSAKSKGGELEVTVQPARELQMRAGFSYADARFKSFERASIVQPLPNGAGQAGVRYDASGNKMIRAPKYTINIALDYSTELSDDKRAGFNFNFYHSAKYYWEFTNRLVQPAYDRLNAQVWLEPTHNIRVGLWGDNLTNAKVLEQATASTSGDYGVYAKPRTAGFFANYNF